MIGLDVQPFKDLQRKIKLLAELYGRCNIDPNSARATVVGSASLIRAPLAAFSSFQAKAKALEQKMKGENVTWRAQVVLASSVKLLALAYCEGFEGRSDAKSAVAAEAKRCAKAAEAKRNSLDSEVKVGRKTAKKAKR